MLLGQPIPFSSLGALVPSLLPLPRPAPRGPAAGPGRGGRPRGGNSTGAAGGGVSEEQRALEAVVAGLRSNAEQVQAFLEEYQVGPGAPMGPSRACPIQKEGRPSPAPAP